jgi:hypothetical protein
MTTHAIVAINNATPTLVSPNGTHSGCDITVQNINESGYVYVGGAGVTTTSYGYRVSPNTAISFELPGYDAIYLIGSTTLNAAVLTMGLEVGD